MTDQEIFYAILGVITEASLRSGRYIATWHICDALGIGREEIGVTLPGTKYDHALSDLVKSGLVCELADLPYRYRLNTEG